MAIRRIKRKEKTW